jgi:hypothetical protein
MNRSASVRAQVKNTPKQTPLATHSITPWSSLCWSKIPLSIPIDPLPLSSLHHEELRE